MKKYILAVFVSVLFVSLAFGQSYRRNAAVSAWNEILKGYSSSLVHDSLSANGIENSRLNYVADTSSIADTIKIALSNVSSLYAGLEVTIKVANSNDAAMGIYVNSLAAKAITKAASGAVTTPIASGDVLANQIIKLVYDGTRFQIISRLAQ